MGFTSQGITVQRLNRGQHNVPGTHTPQNGQSPPSRRSPHNGMHVSIDHRQHVLNSSSRSQGLPRSQQQQQQQGYSIAERQARSSSLKASARHNMGDRYSEFSDAHHQFNNHVTSPYRASSSSSENSPQGSPLRSSPRGSNQILARTGHQRSPASYSRYQHQQQAQQLLHQVPVDNIQEDLNEIQPRRSKPSSGSHGKRMNSESPYRSASRNTFAATGSNVARRVSSSDSFSFASSIKCCVGIQPKKKKASRRAVAYHPQPKIREKEKLTNGTADNWVSLAAVRSQYSPRAYRSSPSQSTVSCPYIVQTPPTHSNGHASKHSSGYVSELETSSCNIMMGDCESESDDMSDSEFARATAGSRGKSANTMMMKLAKKFSKRNLPITRDEGDGSSIGGDSLGKGEGKAWKMKHRSNSVSNLDSLEG